MHKKGKRAVASVLSSVLVVSAIAAPIQLSENTSPIVLRTVSAEDAAITIDDMPDDFKFAADWIWQNRIEREQSTVRRNTIFDQIVAGKGTVNYVVKWQSYRQVTYEQRQKFEKMLSDCINGWNAWLKGYENWPYDHIDVKIVGWAVIDKSCLLDLHDDEIVYTDTRYYDSQYDTSNGREEIPDKEPYAPDELSRIYHFENSNNPEFDAYNYPGGLDKRFDMYMWATQGFPDIGGCGGDWGQRLSDTAYLAMIEGDNIHVLEHEIGHGFGMTDFYGGEGETDGFPPGGFPGGENSLMMAGSAAKITNFDGWMLRYMWTKIKDEDGRFDLENNQPIVTEPPVTTTETILTTTITTTATDIPTTTTTSFLPVSEINKKFTAEIKDVRFYSDVPEMDDWYIQNGYIGDISFNDGTSYLLYDGYSKEESTNLAYYEHGDVVEIDADLSIIPELEGVGYAITNIRSIELIQNVRETTAIPITTLPATTTKTTSAETTSTESATGSDITAIIIGDANEDGYVNMGDVTSIIQHIGNQDLYCLSEQGIANAELCDNVKGITGMDAVAIQYLMAEQIEKLPYIE